MSEQQSADGEDVVAALSASEIAAGDQIAAAAATSVAEQEDVGQDRRTIVGGWIFLTLLFAIFLVLIFWAYNLDDSDDVSTQASTTTTVVEDVALPPTNIEFVVAEDSSVILRGAVEDEGARRQLFEAAVGIYGAGKVTDELTVDPTLGLAGGTINTSGTAPHDDLNVGLLIAAGKQLGLTEGSLDAGFSDLVLTPLAANAVITTDWVALSGAFPEQAAIDSAAQAAADVFGPDNVDTTGTIIDAGTTLLGGTVAISGVLDAGDARGQALIAALADSLPTTTVDGTGIEVDTSPEALGRLEAKLRAAIEASPILFESGSLEIDAASDAILVELAASINAAPGIPVEVVGHTDDSGGEDLNQQLSQDRAIAVLNRLVELGVENSRLKARGAGEGEPIADNGTEEGQAANRRIAFEFEGAAG